MKPPWVNTHGILHFFGEIRRSARFGCEDRALFELRPSPTVVGYGRRRSEGPTVAFIHGHMPVVFCGGE